MSKKKFVPIRLLRAVAKKIRADIEEFIEDIDVIDEIEEEEERKEKVRKKAAVNCYYTRDYNRLVKADTNNPKFKIHGVITNVRNMANAKTGETYLVMIMNDISGNWYPHFIIKSRKHYDQIAEAASCGYQVEVSGTRYGYTDDGDVIFVFEVRPEYGDSYDSLSKDNDFYKERRYNETDHEEYNNDRENYENSENRSCDNYAPTIEASHENNPPEPDMGHKPNNTTTYYTSEDEIKREKIPEIHSSNNNYEMMGLGETTTEIDKINIDIYNIMTMLNVCLEQNYHTALQGIPVHLQSEISGHIINIIEYGDRENMYSCTFKINLQETEHTVIPTILEVLTKEQKWFEIIKEYAENHRAVFLKGTFCRISRGAVCTFFLEDEPKLS